MASTNFDLTNAVCWLPDRTTEVRKTGATQRKKKRRQRGTDLLLFDLGFPRRTTLTLQRLNPSLEGRAQGTCLVDEFFQPLAIASSCSIVCVVQ